MDFYCEKHRPQQVSVQDEKAYPRVREYILRMREETDKGQSIHKGSHDVIHFSDPLYKAAALLTSSDFSDVTFRVGPGAEGESIAEFCLHKFVLMTTSPVFDAMFNGSLPESNVVLLPDVDPDAFQILVEFVYCGLLPSSIPGDLGISLLYIARKYMIERLEELVLDLLPASVSMSDVLLLLEASLLYDLQSLSRLCLEFVNKNIEEIVKQPEFNRLPTSAVIKILQSNDLNISEINLFNALLKWSGLDERSWLPAGRDLLTSCIPYIRFPTMTAAEFASGPAKFLPDMFVAEVFKYICSTGIKPPCHFIKEPRGGRKSTETDEGCECFKQRRNCFFCFRVQAIGGRMSKVAEGSAEPERRPRAGSARVEALSSTPTPPCYCPCRTRGFCPVEKVTQLLGMDSWDSVAAAVMEMQNSNTPPAQPQRRKWRI